MLRQEHTHEDSFNARKLPFRLSHAQTFYEECDMLFNTVYTHISLHHSSSSSCRTPLPLLDLLFSLVRVCLMPLSMLIVHCSKAAFIKMIKHSQTTAKYLKASGHSIWQVTTSHTNNSTSILPVHPHPASIHHIPCLVGHRFSPYVTWAPNEKLSADEGGWLHMTTDILYFSSTQKLLTAHTHTGSTTSC